MNQETSALAKKLLIKPGNCWLFYNAPDNYQAELSPLPGDVIVKSSPGGNADGIQLFILNSAELADNLLLIAPLLKTDTIFWITYPKKSSGIKSDLEMMGSWDEPAKYGLRVVTSISVNETWTALRFKPEEQTKVSDSRNDQIKGNEFAGYIDIENKIVTLPRDVEEVFESNPDAQSFYQSLSYSNKKEYVLWILTAKQEKTRNERLAKMVEKLLAGKKNPAEK